VAAYKLQFVYGFTFEWLRFIVQVAFVNESSKGLVVGERMPDAVATSVSIMPTRDRSKASQRIDRRLQVRRDVQISFDRGGEFRQGAAASRFAGFLGSAVGDCGRRDMNLGRVAGQ
jgi:hypothetical protein